MRLRALHRGGQARDEAMLRQIAQDGLGFPADPLPKCLQCPAWSSRPDSRNRTAVRCKGFCTRLKSHNGYTKSELGATATSQTFNCRNFRIRNAASTHCHE